MKRVRWGLLSTARINRALLPVIRQSERGELVAVASRTAERADAYAAEWEIPQAFGSYEAMIESDAVEAIYVSLPNHLHVEWVVRALRAGKHVLCEKPLALSVDEVGRMAAAAEASGCVLAEAFMYLHHPQTALLSEWVQSGRLGSLQLVRATFGVTMGRPGNYRWDPEMGGGALWDIGVYPVSFVQWLLGKPPQSVLANGDFDATGLDLTVSAQMHYEGGTAAQIFCSFRSPWTLGAEVIGTEGRLVVTRPFNNIDSPDAAFLFYAAGREDDPESVPIPHQPLYAGEVEDLHRAILEGTRPRIPLAASRGHVQTVQALLDSAREERVVRLT